MEKSVSALIIAQPGQLREGLQILLKAIPQVERVNQVDDCSSALIMDCTNEPSIVLLDVNLPCSQIRANVQQIKAKWPHSRYIALVDDENDEPTTSIIADVLLLKGVLASKLFTTIEELL